MCMDGGRYEIINKETDLTQPHKFVVSQFRHVAVQQGWRA